MKKYISLAMLFATPVFYAADSNDNNLRCFSLSEILGKPPVVEKNKGGDTSDEETLFSLDRYLNNDDNEIKNWVNKNLLPGGALQLTETDEELKARINKEAEQALFGDN